MKTEENSIHPSSNDTHHLHRAHTRHFRLLNCMQRFSQTKINQKTTGPLNYYLTNIRCASFDVSLQKCDVRGTCAHMRRRMRPCTRIGNINVIAANRASKLIPGRDEIRPVGRVSSIVRLIDDARSLGPGNERYYENARERGEERTKQANRVVCVICYCVRETVGIWN